MTNIYMQSTYWSQRISELVDASQQRNEQLSRTTNNVADAASNCGVDGSAGKQTFVSERGW